MLMAGALFLTTLLGRAQSPGERPVLKVALGNARINLSPTSQPNQSTMLIMRQIHCQLTRLVEGEVRGEAASSFVFDHARKQIVYTLKAGLTFSDGSPVTPADVAATFKHYIRSRPYVRNVFAWIARVDADAATSQVRITYRRNPTLILKDLSIGLYPLLRARDARPGARVDENHPVGCGAFVMKTRASDHIELVHRALPTRRIQFDLFEDNEISSARAKDFDLVAMSVRGPIGSELREIAIYDPYQIYVLINTARPGWQDRRRRCQALAGFRSDLAVALYAGRAVAADDFYPRGVFGYELKSKFLDLVRRGGEGTPAAMPTRACVAVVRVSVPKSMEPAYASNAILKLTHRPILNSADTIGEFKRSGCDFLVMGLKSNTLDGYEFQIPLNEVNTQFMQYDDPEVRRLIDEGQNLTNPGARFTRYREISDAVARTCTIRPLVTLPFKTVYARRDLRVDGLGDLPLNDVALEWW